MTCIVDGCANPQNCRWLCNKHYLRARAHGLLTSAGGNRQIAERLALLETAPDAKVGALGAQRRIQALVARGWALAAVGVHMGMHRQQVRMILVTSTVSARTLLKVMSVYDELWAATPPRTLAHEKAAYTRALDLAARNGWVPPLAWDDIDNDLQPATTGPAQICDELKVEDALSGRRVKLNRLEREEIVRRAHQLKWSDNRTAETTGIDSRTVGRVRHDLGIESWPFNELEKRTA